MIPFLRLVAEDLFRKYASELSDITVVFPNNRARLFFNEYLSDVANSPVWSPQYTTIQNLFMNCSELEIPDTLKLVGDLFQVYNNHVIQKESFDEFYFWGEILLNDFDDIDKNLIDASALFRNIREQSEFIDTFEHLTEEQKDSLRMFFRNFSPDMRTELKERFIHLWDTLAFVYSDFREKLLKQGLAYEGMLNRIVTEELLNGEIDKFISKKYVFVGFNVLNECEKKLFSILQNAGKTHFYWDYDSFYVDKKYHEAGIFIRDNLLRFPNEFSKKQYNNFNIGEKRKITFVSASTEDAQAKFLDKYFNESKKTYEDSECAAVLCNESLLLPVLHSIPDSVKDINVTMGFPLLQTPAYSLVQNLLEMQLHAKGENDKMRFSFASIALVLRHPYIRIMAPEVDNLIESLISNNRFYPSIEELGRNEFLREVFSPVKTSVELLNWLLRIISLISSYYKRGNRDCILFDEKDILYDDLYKEAFFRIYTQINRIKMLLENDDLQMNFVTLSKLLKKYLSSIMVPFSGEPVKGLQIMGFLETRNLDFKSVVLLSVNEGILPNSGKESSFIPHNLRKGYGMTTIEHKNSLYAYYFYRFLQRAENITLLYNTATEGLNKGQMSRFMLQLLAETDFDIRLQDIRSDIQIVDARLIEVEKTDEIVSSLIEKYDIFRNKKAYLSPSALNNLIDCSLKFYFKYILKLSVDEELTEEVDASMFGTIFHKSVEVLYQRIGEKVEKEDLKNFLLPQNRKYLESIVDSVFKTEYFKLKQDARKIPEYTGEQLINRKVIVDFLIKLLQLDSEYAPFFFLGLEKEVSEEMTVETTEGQIHLRIGGIIDRIDKKDGIVRVVDYKTGGISYQPENVSALFEQIKDRGNYIFQAFLYAVILNRQMDGKYTIKPVLYYIHRAKKDYSPEISFMVDKKNIPVDSISLYEEEFRKYLKRLILDLFDKKVPFKQTQVVEKCSYCDYRGICRRR